MKINKKRKAQQIVEFILVAPFLIIFLGILTEYAYALSINMTLSSTLKDATTNIYREISPSLTEDKILEIVKTKYIDSLKNNNIPTKDENNITLTCVSAGKTTVFMGTYTYYSAFTLPNVFFHFLPEKFNFFVTASVPSAYLESNVYDGIETSALNNVWGATSLTDLLNYNGIKKGIFNNTSTARQQILFFVPFKDKNLENAYALVDWSGNILKPEGESNLYYYFSSKNANLGVCKNVTNTETKETTITCDFTNTNTFDYLSSRNTKMVFFVTGTESSSLDDIKTNWITGTDSPLNSDISSTNITGILKDAISLKGANTFIGNLDNIDVYNYNLSICPKNNLVRNNFGSMIFVDRDAENMKTITNGKSSVAYSDFGE